MFYYDDDEAPKPEPASKAWMLTFADLVSLLICFFVLLYSMKSVDEEKWKEIRGALAGALSFADTIYNSKPDKDSTIEKINLKVSDNLDYLQSLLQTRFLDDPILLETAFVRNNTANTLSIIMPNKLLFRSGTDMVLPEGRIALGRVGDILRHLDNRIEIAGHTDPSPINTTKIPTNWELSILRSLSVRDILADTGLVDPIKIIGFGSSRYKDIDPSLPKKLRDTRARRVEIIVKEASDEF